MIAYRFGPVEVHADQRSLLIDGKPATLGARAFDVLVTLAEHAGRPVSKNDLLDAVWRGVVVEENNLQVQISTLRKLLGARAIATIPGRGYCLALVADAAPTGEPTGKSADGQSGRTAATARPLPEAPVLYGRAADITVLADLIRARHLVSVVGPAGIGKTRVAQAVVHVLHDAFADGVFFVDLASLADADLVPGTILRAIGAAMGGAANSDADTVAQSLADRRMLLVLDNCEHVLDAVDRLAAALRSRAPAVHVLITSQELLRQPGEHVYRLGPLAIPNASALQAAAATGAVELFVARARAAERRFELRDDNVAIVVEICRRLDGIPLAIELAAARVPLLRVEGVRDRLDQRFRLLTAGSRLALRRHQTLLAALEWSYALLSEAERFMFDRLGVFVGSFSLECAQDLAAADAMDEWQVLDHLGALVDKSLVNVEQGAPTRYRMLETTRAFALEQLASRGETEAAMRRHAELMLQVFEHFYATMLDEPRLITAVDRLAPDLDNVRGALRWAGAADGDRALAVALFGAVCARLGYFHYLIDKTERWQWCETLWPFAASAPAPHAARFWLACSEVGAAFAPAKGVEAAQRAVTLYRELGDRLGTHLACKQLAFASLQTGRLDAAMEALDQALALFDPAWPSWLRGQLHNVAALVLMHAPGALGAARAQAVEYLAAARQADSYTDVSGALAILVSAELALGNIDQAVALAGESVARHRVKPYASDDGLSLRSLATALMSGNRLDEAERAYRDALALVRRNYGTGAFVLYDAASLVALRGRIDDAARILAYAERVYDDQGRMPRLIARQLAERLLARVTAERSPDVAAQLRAEGRALTDDEACALAFPPVGAR